MNVNAVVGKRVLPNGRIKFFAKMEERVQVLTDAVFCKIWRKFRSNNLSEHNALFSGRFCGGHLDPLWLHAWHSSLMVRMGIYGSTHVIKMLREVFCCNFTYINENQFNFFCCLKTLMSVKSL